jgi:uncharacterized protein YecE (DUF72 family)
MDFGKVDDKELNKIDFRLPADREETTALLARHQTGAPSQVFVGCAKWGRKDWLGKIYPEGTKEKDFLTEYAHRFNCIELNATFYRLPTVEQVTGWKEKAGDGFKFCPKFTDKITHIKRLKDAGYYTEAFLEGINAFGDSLGPVFLQTPPNYAPKSLEVLDKYIELLPDDLDLFVELRHPGWYSDPAVFKDVFDMLERHEAGAVITDASGRRDCVHMRLTTPSAFIRFVGNGLHPTDFTRIDDWVQRIKQWMEQGIERIYFFMHQHEELHSPELSRYIIQQLNEHCGTAIPEPEFVAPIQAKPARRKTKRVTAGKKKAVKKTARKTTRKTTQKKSVVKKVRKKGRK